MRWITFLGLAMLLSSLNGAPVAATGHPAGEALPSEMGNAVWGPLDATLAGEAVTVRDTCKEPNLRECGALALHYSRATARLEDQPEKAATLYRMACADGYPWACYLLGELARRQPGQRPEAALTLLRTACDDDERRACLSLGEMLETGDGVPADPARARAIYETECAASRAAGCWRLARLLEEDDAVSERERIEESYLRACTGGMGESCFHLAEFLQTGGEASERVTYYFAQACDRRHLRGCLRYADRLDTGTGVEQDPSLAASLFHKTCGAQLAEGCLRLAALYRAGRGVSTSLETAVELEARACALGLTPACKGS